jgi:inositol-hexakisphosphate kinase
MYADIHYKLWTRKVSLLGMSENRGDEASGDYISQLTKDGPVELVVYGHQVGGHSLLMKFGKAVCKPMIPRERFFYTSIPKEIREFTPVYYGVANIKFQQRDGEIQLIAVPRLDTNGENHKQEEPRNSHANLGEFERECGPPGREGAVVGEVEALSQSHPIVRLDFFKATDGFSHNKHEEIIKESNGAFSNPWSSACMNSVQSVLSHYGERQLQNMFQDYVVLEDLTRKYQCPCILDLKMGMRQHGDDQSDEKKRKHTERCALSTSAHLGVRISGMQVYNASLGAYTFKDKYYGRELDPVGFHRALRDFLHNGSHLRTDIIPILIKMLSQLRVMIKSQDSFRFFSSSLLIMYDGRTTPPPFGFSLAHS